GEDPSRRRPGAGLDDVERQGGEVGRPPEADQGFGREEDRRRCLPADVHPPRNQARRQCRAELRGKGPMVSLIRDAWRWLDLKKAKPQQTPQGEDAPSVVPVGPAWPGLMPQANAAAAMRSAAVWACCNIISKAVASLPTQVLEETDTGSVPA